MGAQQHDLDAVLARATAAGVSQMVVTGATREGAKQALDLARAHPGRLFATDGAHPHHALEVTDEAVAELRELLAQPEVVAVGECGLDYFRDFAPRHAQRRAFERQLELAVDCGKTLFLHQRDAHDDFPAILKALLGAHQPGDRHWTVKICREVRSGNPSTQASKSALSREDRSQ